VLPVDEAGNWTMVADVGGLPALPEDGYYELWLTEDHELSVSCGRFRTPASGDAEKLWFNAPYPFDDYERWVVVAVRPGSNAREPMLEGPVVSPA
jgi:hypothetical protein